MSKETVNQATEKIAKRISEERTGSDALWELFLHEAYREYYGLASIEGQN